MVREDAVRHDPLGRAVDRERVEQEVAPLPCARSPPTPGDPTTSAEDDVGSRHEGPGAVGELAAKWRSAGDFGLMLVAQAEEHVLFAVATATADILNCLRVPR